MRSPQIPRRRLLAAASLPLLTAICPMASRAAVDDDPVTVLAHSLVADARSDRERAVALHDYVRDEVKFGFTGRFYQMTAAEVLDARVGYCNTKSTLFVALLRAVGLQARQQFVDIDAAVLRGLLDPGTPFVDHSYVEVRLDGQWIATDSYIVDRALHSAARRRLQREGRKLGYGVHRDGSTAWDGRQPAFSQYVMADADIGRRRWGVFDGVEAFYAATPDAWNRRSLLLRLVLPRAARRANAAADALRMAGTSTG